MSGRARPTRQVPLFRPGGVGGGRFYAGQFGEAEFETTAGVPGGMPGRVLYARKRREAYVPTRWFDAVVPGLLAPPAAAPAPKPADARALERLLDRKPDLAKLSSGLRIERVTETLADGQPAGTRRRTDLYSPTTWARRTGGDAERSHVEWCDGTERGVAVPMFGIARTRPAAPG